MMRSVNAIEGFVRINIQLIYENYFKNSTYKLIECLHVDE